MKTILSALTFTAALFAAFCTFGQSNTVPAAPAPPVLSLTNGPIQLLESYLVDNDPAFNGWQSNHFTVWQAAVFASVNGTPGASAEGNDLGLEVPVYAHEISLDSVTRFEQVFGDIHSQQFGLQYDYNLNQIQASVGLDARYTFTGHAVNAVPYVELKKASTSLRGIGTFLRYGLPIRKNPGGGEVDVGVEAPF